MNDEFTLHPSTFTLSASPNPFRPRTTIRFTLTQPGPVTLAVYDVLGRRVAKLLCQSLHAGQHQVPWEAESEAAGLYFVQLRGPEGSQTEKLVLL